MKIRQGFVSNSSSSSFYIACKGKLEEATLLDLLQVGKDSPLRAFAEEMATFIAKNAKLGKEHYKGEDPEDLSKTYRELIATGLDVYVCWAGNDGDTVEQALYNLDVDNRGQNPDFIIVKAY